MSKNGKIHSPLNTVPTWIHAAAAQQSELQVSRNGESKVRTPKGHCDDRFVISHAPAVIAEGRLKHIFRMASIDLADKSGIMTIKHLLSKHLNLRTFLSLSLHTAFGHFPNILDNHGSTLLTAYYAKGSGLISYVGDSAAFLVVERFPNRNKTPNIECFALSEPHTTANPRERERIEKALRQRRSSIAVGSDTSDDDLTEDRLSDPHSQLATRYMGRRKKPQYYLDTPECDAFDLRDPQFNISTGCKVHLLLLSDGGYRGKTANEICGLLVPRLRAGFSDHDLAQTMTIDVAGKALNSTSDITAISHTLAVINTQGKVPYQAPPFASTLADGHGKEVGYMIADALCLSVHGQMEKLARDSDHLKSASPLAIPVQPV